MTRPVPRRRASASSWMVAVGFGTGALTWLSLTTVPLLPARVVLALAFAVILAALLVARRQGGRRRWLALSGGLGAALPLLVIATLLSVSDG